MAPATSRSLLRASLIFFLSSLMLGSAAMYVQFGIVTILLVWVLGLKGMGGAISGLIKETRPVWILLFLFALVFALALLFSEVVPFGEMSELKWIGFLFIFSLAFSAIKMEVRTSPIEKFAIGFLLIASVYSTICSTYQILTGANLGRTFLFGDHISPGHRGTGLLRNPIPFAHVVGSLFHISIVGAIIAVGIKKKRLAVILAVIALMFFLCVLTSLARGAWFAIALTAVFSLFVIPKSFQKINLIGLGVSAVLGVIMLAANSSLYQRFVSAFDPQINSNSIRLHLWHSNWEILKEHPFGIGFNANDTLVPAKLAELGYPATSFQSHPHNEFVDYAVAAGFPGIILYLAVTIWLLVFTAKLLRRAAREGATGEVFLLTSSALVQSFANACALTDQFTTPGRFLICLAWAVPLGITARRRVKNSVPGECASQ